MKKYEYAPIRTGLFAVILPLMGGCATTPPSLTSSADPYQGRPWAEHKKLPSGQTTVIAAETATSDADVDSDTDADAYEEETPELWDKFNSTLFPPDPEHITLETDPALVPDVVEKTSPATTTDETGHAPDLWDRVRGGFAFPRQDDNPRIHAELDWYASHPAYLDRAVERARPYLYIIVDSLEQRGMPMELALLPIVESAYQPFAYSSGRAAGIWQFIPSTGTHFGLKQNWWYDGRRDILASTRAALDYLQALHDDLGNDWLLALAAYNSGAGTVSRAIQANQRRGKPTDFWSLHLPAETRAYVPKLIALAELFGNPARYALDIHSIPDEPVVRTVQTGSQIELAKVAELSETSLDEIYRLNPAFNRWATDPAGPHELLMPLDKAELFEANLATLSDDDRVTWQHYVIRKGDSLGVIARRFHTSVDVLRQFNHIRGNAIRAGHDLLIPTTKGGAGYALNQATGGDTTRGAARAGRKLIYSVRSGDTLWDIARRHDVELDHLAQWNSLSPRDPLRVGQRLSIWQAADDDLNAEHPANTTKRIKYVVRKGDSLARISQRFNVKISELRDWNSLRTNDYLQPGQKLTLYIAVTTLTENI
jgi:membrane-bound lytic murein transglycosylase D